MKRLRGFTLLEVMLALCVLCIVIFGFWKIIDRALQLTTIAEQDSSLRIKIWNDLDHLRTQRIQVGSEQLPADADGVEIKRVISELSLKNGNQYVRGMYSVQITATSRDKKNPLTAELYVYQP